MQEPEDDFELTASGPDYSKFTWAVLRGVGIIIIGINHARHPLKYTEQRKYRKRLREGDFSLGTWDDLTKEEEKPRK